MLLLLLPTLLLGTIIGAVFNAVFPQWLIAILLILLQVYVTRAVGQKVVI